MGSCCRHDPVGDATLLDWYKTSLQAEAIYEVLLKNFVSLLRGGYLDAFVQRAEKFAIA